MGLLVRMGVYENVCTPEQIAAGAFDETKCPEQHIKISGLLSVFRITEFVTSMGLGVFMDVVGPKICIIVGIVLRIASWLLLSNFPRVNWVMITGCVLTGLTVNAIIFPVYTIGRYWVAYQDIGMCVISVCLSLGCFYTLLVNMTLDIMPTVSIGGFIALKLIITHVPMLAMSVFIFPNNIIKDIESNLTDSMAAKNREMNIKDENGDEEPWKIKTFISYVVNPEVLAITLVFILNCISLTFAQESFTQVYENDKFAEKFNSIMLPLSSVFSFIFMWVINMFGVVVVIFGMNLVSVLMHLFLLFRGTWASIIVSICISVTFSGFITFFFIFLEKIVDIKYSGSIKGYLTTVAGISLAINIALNSILANHQAIAICQIAFIVARVLMILPLVWLLRKERKRMAPKEADPKEEDPKEEEPKQLEALGNMP